MTQAIRTFAAGVLALASLIVVAGEAVAKDAPRACAAPTDTTRLDYPLVQTAKRLSSGEPLKVVAIGSSSTAGAGASSPTAAYPSRLQAELRQRFPGRPIEVINRGANGDTAVDMLARFEREVIAEKPNLVLWQVGSNTVLRDEPHLAAGGLIREGVKRLKAIGADVVLMNPQFAPKIIAKAHHAAMVELIETAAKENHVPVFRRFLVMKHWRETQGIPFDVFLSEDELHMNDWSYECIAKLLGLAIAEAATRPSAPIAASVLPKR